MAVRKDEKLSVAFLYDDSLDNTDGVTQYVKTLGKWYSGQGHKITYLVGESKTKEWAGGRVYSLSRNLNVRWGGNRLSISLFPKLKLINRVMQENHFDVIHVQIPYSPFMARQVMNRTAPTTAVVGTVHVYPSGQLAVIGSRILKRLYGKSWHKIDLLASVSSAAQEYAKNAFGSDSTIQPNVVDLQRYEQKTARKTKNTKTILFLGRLVKRKGASYLLRAFALIAEEFDNIELKIAGVGPDMTRMKKLAEDLKISAKVEFLGFIEEKDKPAILASADIACFPSLYGESFGIVLIEAMASGAGVVIGGRNEGYITVLAATPEAIVEPKNIPNFADKIGVFLNDRKLTSKVHQVQQAEVKKYDVRLVGKQWLASYNQAIAKRRQTSDN